MNSHYNIRNCTVQLLVNNIIHNSIIKIILKVVKIFEMFEKKSIVTMTYGGLLHWVRH